MIAFRKTFARQTALAFTVAALALVALTAFAPTPAHAAVSAEPTLTCPSGYEVLGTYSGEVFHESDGRVPSIFEANVTLNTDMDDVFMTVASGVGHPEQGCHIGGGNDGGTYPCDQGQLDEEFTVTVFGNGTFISDHGEDKWQTFPNIQLGAQNDGTYPVKFEHSNESSFTPPSAESVFFKAVICGDPVDPPPPPPPPPGEWNKSSLEFRGSTNVSNGTVSALVCNGGDGDMTGSVMWELYQANRGNPKRGDVIASGTFGPLDSGECTTLSVETSETGNFKFKAYQESGHPGRGELWSD